LLQSLLPALDLSRLHSSGALSAVSMASYKAVMSMALNGRHELLRPPRPLAPHHVPLGAGPFVL